MIQAYDLTRNVERSLVLGGERRTAPPADLAICAANPLQSDNTGDSSLN